MLKCEQQMILWGIDFSDLMNCMGQYTEKNIDSELVNFLNSHKLN